MKRLLRLAEGKLRPQDLEIVKGVFDLVASQPWFDPNEYSAEGFAVRLIALYRYGLTDPRHLEKIALVWAVKDFTRSMTNDQRAKLKASYGTRRSSSDDLP
ncbi:hypothetical protein [Rhizobium sp. WW_1]|jgi:hypothetical protein|uniref:hypothetical protein n=1 Tax=Rhizobium sp. WW_1 TaxID=1907375 RepID=UPI000646AF83|nr:hypothetical protein [Rhizobium sp. WW_1]RKD35453.1 hypothetical protein BJ928_1514 [Rhizobium sp. WW_1]